MELTLLRNLTFVGQQGDLRFADWVAFTAGCENAQLVVIVKSRTGASTIDLHLQSSLDADSVIGITATFMTTCGPATTIVNTTSGLGPQVRLSPLAPAVGGAQIALSVFLTSKRN